MLVGSHSSMGLLVDSVCHLHGGETWAVSGPSVIPLATSTWVGLGGLLLFAAGLLFPLVHGVKALGIAVVTSPLWDRVAGTARLTVAFRLVGVGGPLVLLAIYGQAVGLPAVGAVESWYTPYFGLHVLRQEVVFVYVLVGMLVAVMSLTERTVSPLVVGGDTLVALPGFLSVVVAESTPLTAFGFTLTAVPLVVLPLLGRLDRQGATRRRVLTSALFVAVVLVGTLVAVRIPYVEYVPRDDPSWVFLPVVYGMTTVLAGLPLYLLGAEWDHATNHVTLAKFFFLA